jgi:hypothetical protein
VSKYTLRYSLSDYRDRTIPLRCGPISVGLRVDARYCTPNLFACPPGTVPDYHIDLVAADTPQREIPESYTRRDEQGFSFQNDAVCGTLDRTEKQGHFKYWPAASDPRRGVRPLHDVAMSVFLDEVTRRGGLLLHGLTMSFRGKAIVICGASGRGKSTLFGRFQRRVAGEALENARLGDEYAFVAPQRGGGWEFWSYPMGRGPYYPRPLVSELGAIMHLAAERHETVLIPLGPAAATGAVAASAFVPGGLDAQQVLDAAATIATALPSAMLRHNLDTPVERVADVIAAIVEQQ